MKIILPLESGNILIDDIARSKRKTMSITIGTDLIVRVKVPYWVTNREIEDFILQNKEWIRIKLSQMANKPKAEPKVFSQGEQFLFLGKSIKLRYSLGREIVLTNEDELLIPVLFADDTKDMVIRWYREQAESIIKERCRILSEKVNIYPAAVKINSAKTRWGSCSRSGNLNFTWKLIMAPMYVVDYVILHELAHLIHHNHSKNYWNLVKKFMPAYMLAEKWLKKNHIYTNI